MIVINGIDLRADRGVGVEDIKRAIMPSRDVQIMNLDVGARIGKITRSHLIIDCTIRIEGNTTERRAKCRELAPLLDHDELKELYFTDEPEMKYDALVVGDTGLDEAKFTGKASVKFLVPNPYPRGENVTLLIPSSPYDLQYGGSAPTRPIFSVTFETTGATYFEIGNNGKKVRVTRELFMAGDQLIVDCGTGKITLNGMVDQTMIAMGSRFFDVSLADDTIIYAVDGGVTISVEITYDERWK